MLVFAEDGFGYLALVVAYETVGGIDYRLSGAIVLFELKQTRVVVSLLETEDVVDVCTTEAVDTLCIVAYHAYHLSVASKLVDNGLLC